MNSGKKTELPIIPFSSQEEWEKWLEANHAISDGIWLQIYKKGSGIPSVVYSEALDEALCYGWIDGQLKSGDEKFYLQRFTPRRPRSTWSKRNIEHVARLEQQGKMKSSGWKAIEKAKADGRWENAYDSQANFKVPEDLLEELSKNQKSLEFFESLNKLNRYAICWRIQSAKNPVIRTKRMKMILEMLTKGEKFHP
ncbi:MAG TPA: YdeI/OmpD-associated family protein [Prolixibacteraceae bacterium]|nr:YdeI/OmpD-associated family protein [Prolixibacteraceae bacterium]